MKRGTVPREQKGHYGVVTAFVVLAPKQTKAEKKGRGRCYLVSRESTTVFLVSSITYVKSSGIEIDFSANEILV